MMDTTIGHDALDEAFAAFVQAQDNGQQDVVRQMLRDHPGLAERVAMYFALCARVPQPWESSVNSYAGHTLGDFELLHELGRGGEGEVYKARQKSLDRYVAVKVMRRERFSQEDEKQRFQRDSTLLASLPHPNIVQIYSAGESETGVPYFAMELMQESLKDKLGNGWLPTPKQAAELTLDLAKAVQWAHGKKIVHRDLKPGNILLDAAGTPKIVDFGLGKQLDAGTTMTKTGVILGTASYMAPESANGQDADLSCDIYGLGAILYELLTGRAPFVGDNVLDILEHVKNDEPVPIRLISPGVPRDLEAICLKCLEKDKGRRYLSAEELAADLQRFHDGEPVHARLPGIAGRAVRALLRHQFTSITAWGWPLLLAGIVTAVSNLIMQWVIWSEQPEWVWLGTGLATVFLYAFPFWITLRHRQFGVGDRQALVFAMAPLAAICLLPAVYRPGDGMNLTAYRLSLYPTHALIVAVSELFGGALFWGGFYLSALVFVLLAFLMQLIPEWSPLLFGTYAGALEILVGWYLLKLGKSAAFRN